MTTRIRGIISRGIAASNIVVTPACIVTGLVCRRTGAVVVAAAGVVSCVAVIGARKVTAVVRVVVRLTTAAGLILSRARGGIVLQPACACVRLMRA